MENWCYHRPTLKSFAKHFKTGEELSEEIIDRLMAARTFREGYQTLRQLNFAFCDLALHQGFIDPKGASFGILLK